MIVYHARLFGLHGGFVGVDVFFVVSGFLITRLILGELAKTGRLSLPRSGAGGPAGLLAASALVVVATALARTVVLPPLTQRSVVTDVVAAATFSSNIVFADRLGSYFGAQLGQSTPSPLLHFWSLAVEEQFYLCWPPLLVAAHPPAPAVPPAAAGDDRHRSASLGFALAAWMTPRAPSWAFFLLPTRMGELLAGALLAVVGTQISAHPGRRRGPRWRGAGWPSSSSPACASTRRCRGRAPPSSCRCWPRWRVIVGGSMIRPLGVDACSGSGGTPTRCTRN